jgi:hypothetical protein
MMIVDCGDSAEVKEQDCIACRSRCDVSVYESGMFLLIDRWYAMSGATREFPLESPGVGLYPE